MMNLLLVVLLVSLSLAQSQASDSCKNWEERKARFNEAKEAWSNPSCYSFHFVNETAGLTSERDVQVKNGEAMNIEDLAINGIFSQIESLCLSDCSEKGTFSCDISYAGLRGFPLKVFIDKNAYTAGEEIRYTISNVVEKACDLVNPQVVGGAERGVDDSDSAAPSR